MLLLTMFAWLTANIHSAVSHCVCADACHEGYSGSPTESADSFLHVSPGSSGASFISSSTAPSCLHRGEPDAAESDMRERGCCDSPDSNICLEHTQELVTAPVSFGSNSALLSLSLSQFVNLHACWFHSLVCAVAKDPVHERSYSSIPDAEDNRTVGWLHLVHTALPVRGPSILG